MGRLSGGGEPSKATRPPERQPPRWLLPLGCAAVALLLAGALLGGALGDLLAAIGGLALYLLVGAFLVLLARAHWPPRGR